MKHGSAYAQQVRRLYRQMLKQFGKPDVPAPGDPIDQLILGILSACTTDHKAAAVYRRLREQTVDLNELRVTPAVELAEMIGAAVPLGREKAQRIVDVLNGIRRRQDKIDLSFLLQRTRREAREFLESLEGVDKGAAASVVLFSLGGHAVPLDDLILYVLRQEGVVNPEADLAEVQGFLERTIPADETAAFSLLLCRYAVQKAGRVPVERLRQLLTPAPPAPAPPAPAPAPTPAESSPVGKPAAPAVPAVPAGKNGKQDGRGSKPEKAAARPKRN
jgi:endonuclease III